MNPHSHAHSKHPDVHGPWQRWSNDETLHVACAYSNPFRWHTRRRLMNNFRHQMSAFPNVKLYVGELAYGNRPFEVTGDHHNDVRFRTNSELFHKENVINEVVKRFPDGWKYGAYIDGDFTFTRYDWALEAIHQLQHYDWAQLFSTYTDLGQLYRPTSTAKSFAATYFDNGYKLPAWVAPGGWGRTHYNYHGKPPYIPVGATGGGWAFTREAFETTGGLMDKCILGHADWFMTFGLVSRPAPDMHDDRYHSNYLNYIKAWQNKAAELKNNIGFVDQHAVHHFHGDKKNRGYTTRDLILVNHEFDPLVDITKNWQGIYELTGNKPALRDAIRAYFISRNEDSLY